VIRWTFSSNPHYKKELHDENEPLLHRSHRNAQNELITYLERPLISRNSARSI
jgi:hypothetical protein